MAIRFQLMAISCIVINCHSFKIMQINNGVFIIYNAHKFQTHQLALKPYILYNDDDFLQWSFYGHSLTKLLSMARTFHKYFVTIVFVFVGLMVINL